MSNCLEVSRNLRLCAGAEEYEARISELEAEVAKYTGEDRPQYCVCDEHPHVTVVHKLATYSCPVCRAEAAEVKLDKIEDAPRYMTYEGDNEVEWIKASDIDTILRGEAEGE